MTDFASIGIEFDTRQVAEGMKVLESLGDTSAKVEQKVGALNGQMNDTGQIMRMQAEAAAAASEASKRFTDNLQREIDLFGRNRAETERYNAAMAGLSGTTQDVAAAMGMKIDALHREEKAARDAAAAEDQMTKAADRFMKSLQDQVATLGMSKAQILAYQAAQMGLTAETAKSVAALKAHEDAVRAAAKAEEDAAKSANTLSDTVKFLASAYAALKIGEYIKDSALLAARYETLGIVTEVVGKNAGYTKTQMDFATDAIARQGITMIEARESAVKLVQAHVDLKNATVLARIAQDAAVIGHINSSEAFDRLVNGIARGNVLILRNIGINVNLQSAYRGMADELGKTTQQLTENERVQARLNAVIERGTDISGTYEAAMGTASKQIASMQRYTQDLKTTLGETFTEALTVMVMGLTKGLKDANGEVTELSKNKQLEAWGHALTAVFVGISDAVGNLFTAMQKADAFAQHMDARQAIGKKYDSQVADNISNSKLTTLSGVTSFYDQGKRIDSARQAALAEENVGYVQEQAALTANFDRFGKAYDDFSKSRQAKQKADGDARIKVDQDYATKAQALLMANADKSVATQQAAQMKLYKDTYVGTPEYRDTEGREPKPKTNAADNTRLADQLKRYETEAVAAKAENDYLAGLDDMRHKAGEMGDQEYYENRRNYASLNAGAEIAGYDKELAALRDHNLNTENDAAKNAKAIHDIEDKKSAAKQKFAYADLTADEEDRLRQAAVVSASDDAANKYISSLNAQMTAVDAANGKRAKSASSIAAETAAQTRAAAALMAEQAAGPADNGHTQADADAAAKMLITLNLEADAQERLAAAIRDGEAAAASRKLAEQAIGDWQRVGSSIADSLTNAFGTGGKAIGQMYKAYADGQAEQLRAQEKLKTAKDKLDSDPEKVDAINRAQLQGTQAQLKSYGDIADAAQGYFDKGSKGYEAIGAASKVLHAAEMAMNLASIGPKMAAGAASFFAESGWGGFAGVAAMVAVVAGFGVAVSGGGGGSDTTAKDRQAATGTGTVLGDSSAKSDSINRAIGLTAKNTSTLIDYTASMVAALNSIETNIGSFASEVLKTSTVTSALPPDQLGTASKMLASPVFNIVMGGAVGLLAAGVDKLLGGKLGAFVGKIGNAVFGGNVTSLDTGVTATKTALGTAVSTGIQASQYTDTKTDGGWFHSDKYNTQLASLGAAANDQFTLIIKSMADSVTEAAKLIGVGGDAFSQHLNAFVVDIGKISTKDMTGDDIQKALETAFSKVGDDMANWAVAGLGQFQKVGEGSLETLVRVATDYAKLDASLVSVGLTFGQTGIASIAARESLIALLGGIDNFQSTVADYSKNFLTQAEQLAPVAKYVNDQLGTMGLSWIKTRADFKAEIDSLSGNLSDAGVQQTYAALMNLESAFAAVTPAIEDTTKSMQEISDERKNLQDQLDTLTMTSAQLLAKQRNALDASNQSLFDQVQAATAAKAAQDALKTSLTDTISSMKSFKDSTQQLHDGLLTGSNSPLTPEQQYAESKRQYEATKAAAMGGDTAAQGQYAAMLNSFLAASKVVNASDSQYTADFAETLADSNAMAKWAGTQVDTAQASLDALNAQIAGITDVNTSVQGVTAAVNSLTTSLGGTPAVTMPTPVLSAVTVNNDNPALVAQVAEMTAELRQLRADMATQTGDQIKGTADATKAAAETVVSGTGSLASTITRAASYAKMEYA